MSPGVLAEISIVVASPDSWASGVLYEIRSYRTELASIEWHMADA